MNPLLTSIQSLLAAFLVLSDTSTAKAENKRSSDRLNFPRHGQCELHGKHQQPKNGSSCFQMPLHYPRYTKADYESMPEWKLNCLLQEYVLLVTGDVNYKRKFAMAAFVWSAD